ncbi:Hypothetical protein BHO_0053800 [Borrelia hermsii YBT]|nr:hypothetical protein [Borrelia hermsii]AHH12639.1 Hypothetical protein BHO_0053800 [Borrelia hermsii YBT]
MKDGVRKPSGSRTAFNFKDPAKNVIKNNLSPFSNSNFGKSFTKKKKGK